MAPVRCSLVSRRRASDDDPRPNRRLRFARNGGHARLAVSDNAVKHENIFIAKTYDSESARAVLRAVARAATHAIALCARKARFQENAFSVGFFCNRDFCRHRCGRHFSHR